jgi:7,8-dihydroneopterin aldolase/epimerase/oxygenase
MLLVPGAHNRRDSPATCIYHAERYRVLHILMFAVRRVAGRDPERYNPPMASDTISLTGLVFYGYHGTNPEEAALGQRFGVDLEVWVDLSVPARSDRLEDTISYAGLFKLVREEVEGATSRLLEHLAGRILRKVLSHDKRVQRARVSVTKLSPPLKESTAGTSSVTLERDRSWLTSA